MSRDGFDALQPILPSGRPAPAVPAAARELVDAARAAGWLTLVQWGEASNGAPFLGVDVGIAEPFHYYRLCWHSFNANPPMPYDLMQTDVSGFRLRLFSKLVRTSSAYWRDAPSLTAITKVITTTTVIAAKVTRNTENK